MAHLSMIFPLHLHFVWGFPSHVLLWQCPFSNSQVDMGVPVVVSAPFLEQKHGIKMMNQFARETPWCCFCIYVYISITFHNYTHTLGQAGKPYIWSKPMVCWICCYFFQPIHSLHAGFHVGLLPDCLHKASGNAGTYGLSLHFFPWTMLIYIYTYIYVYIYIRTYIYIILYIYI